MFNRIVLAAVALAISAAVVAAKGEPKKKEECTTHGYDEIEKRIREAPSYRRAVAVFEICEFGASGDVGLGAAVTEKCEGFSEQTECRAEARL